MFAQSIHAVSKAVWGIRLGRAHPVVPIPPQTRFDPSDPPVIDTGSKYKSASLLLKLSNIVSLMLRIKVTQGLQL